MVRDSQQTGISHVLKAIRLDGSHARGTVRISLGYENRGEEIHEIVAALAGIVAGRQEMPAEHAESDASGLARA